MADSKQNSNKTAPDSFADDLDSMLNLDESSERQVDLIDDDDAIDRLLIDDALFDDDHQPDTDDIANDPTEQAAAIAGDFDEFGDDADDFFSTAKDNNQAEEQVDDSDDFSADNYDLTDDVELPELNTTSEAEETVADMPEMSATSLEAEEIEDSDLENMAEIDESSDSADFLMADFDISPDDEDQEGDDSDQMTESAASDSEQPESAAVPEQTMEIEAEIETELEAEVDEEIFSDQQETISVTDEAETPNITELEPTQAADTVDLDAVQNLLNDRIAELNAQLMAVNEKITHLSKQQSQLKQNIQLKSNKEELDAFFGEVDSLKAEVKKNKRNVDAVSGRKPISAYVANGLAVIALVVGAGLGSQGYIAKSQVKELADYLVGIKEQITAAPTADAAEKAMLRQRLDEITASNTTLTQQVAELTAALQGGEGGLGSDFDGKLESLNAQDMQIGETLEELQKKVEALEKGRKSISSQSTAKKPATITENWAVNLVAFKQDWYAKRKAEEYAAKGVPAKVSRVDVKGDVWYRLTVDGFKSKYEAAAYAAKIKKSLNLDSVWVAKAK